MFSTINIEHKEYQKYIYNKQFVKSQNKRYLSWHIKYSKTGELSLPRFEVKTLPDQIVKMILSATRDPEHDLYGVTAYLFLSKYDELMQHIESHLCPFVIYLGESLGNQLHVYIDIADHDVWRHLGVKTFNDLPPETQKGIVDYWPSILALWAKIQNDAFKCKKRIIRLEKVEKPEDKKRKTKTVNNNVSQNKPIILSPGITYSISSGEPRSFTRHCEAWMVRGHYRHYKTGKVVYVRPHKKGKGRLKQTVYELPK